MNERCKGQIYINAKEDRTMEWKKLMPNATSTSYLRK